ncbi:nuclear envelope pore membrane protein POM 121C-like [Mirounga angustirostris]|uniref:nuclear envelope pore membrane protein POM 121C-like n=1 Tax=Mirounga angustirostris TaxID=9716 RepID=UPI00313C9852
MPSLRGGSEGSAKVTQSALDDCPPGAGMAILPAACGQGPALLPPPCFSARPPRPKGGSLPRPAHRGRTTAKPPPSRPEPAERRWTQQQPSAAPQPQVVLITPLYRASAVVPAPLHGAVLFPPHSPARLETQHGVRDPVCLAQFVTHAFKGQDLVFQKMEKKPNDNGWMHACK